MARYSTSYIYLFINRLRDPSVKMALYKWVRENWVELNYRAPVYGEQRSTRIKIIIERLLRFVEKMDFDDKWLFYPLCYFRPMLIKSSLTKEEPQGEKTWEWDYLKKENIWRHRNWRGRENKTIREIEDLLYDHYVDYRKVLIIVNVLKGQELSYDAGIWDTIWKVATETKTLIEMEKE